MRDNTGQGLTPTYLRPTRSPLNIGFGFGEQEPPGDSGDLVRGIFANSFRFWDITLSRSAVEERQPGTIRKDRWHIQYLFGSGDYTWYMDYYARHPMTSDRHVRIWASGDVKWLPALMDSIWYPANSTEEQREKIRQMFRRRNARVAEMLRRKGFLRSRRRLSKA